MKSIASKKIVLDILVSALKKAEDADELLKNIRKAFELVYKELPLLILYELNLVETEKLRYLEFYQTGPILSKLAIQIKGPKYSEYIWRDSGEWVMADEFYSAKDISEAICKAYLFVQVPETVKDLMLLLTQGFWKFIPGELPKYGGGEPKDSLEVLSWDDQNLLVGTRLENIEVLSREEWDNLSAREKNWLK